MEALMVACYNTEHTHVDDMICPSSCHTLPPSPLLNVRLASLTTTTTLPRGASSFRQPPADAVVVTATAIEFRCVSPYIDFVVFVSGYSSRDHTELLSSSSTPFSCRYLFRTCNRSSHPPLPVLRSVLLPSSSP
eukprot:TRINITY_DN1022_c0_g6_i1.p1 TRINITY_DN1022_c0_g6~~TRINITY_DN1022_c0_g6_i1.p1  ORF type:complete len:134 (-),score=18.24 TRINITY_DN1022_c0_g6_i1:76-477(-)